MVGQQAVGVSRRVARSVELDQASFGMEGQPGVEEEEEVTSHDLELLLSGKRPSGSS